MTREDFVKLIGAESGQADYLPVACLLKTGQGLVGYFNAQLNADLSDSCVLLNAHLVEFREASRGSRSTVSDFNDFLEQIVMRMYSGEGADAAPSEPAVKTIPLAAVALADIAVLYPVAHIGTMMQRLQQDQDRIPAFLDFDRKSIVLKILRTKLW